MLAERLYKERARWAGSWNFGPREEDAVTVASLSDRIIRQWGEGSWQAAPERAFPPEAHYLKLDCSKARQVLGWRPCLSLEEAVGMTVVWYREAFSARVGQGMYEATCDQIRTYVARWKTA